MTGYTRQEVFNDGDVILAEHGNNEFDQVEASMAASSGHTHNGASGEGGFIGKLADVTDTQKVEITGTGARVTTDLDVIGAISVGTTVDGRDVAADGIILDGIVAGTGLTAADIVNVPAGDIVATDVQAAIDELDTEKAALAGATFTGPLVTSSTVDGRDVATDGTKLDTIEASAKDDQIASEVVSIASGNIVATDVQGALDELDLEKAALAGAAFTGAITTTSTVDGRDVSVDGTKLDTIETSATADQTNTEIKTAYEANADTNEFSDAEQTKLAGIETSAKDDQSAAEVVFTPAGGVVATDVQAAIVEVKGDIALQIAAKVHHNEVVDVNFAASPYSVTVTNDGNMIQVDTSGGNVVLNLVDSTGLFDDMRFSVVKYTADANTVTVNRSGTDTINGSTSQVIATQYEHVHFVLDQSDGEWLAAGGVIGAVDAASVTNTPAGNITATDVQAAINELDTLGLPTRNTVMNQDPISQTEATRTGMSSTIYTGNGTSQAVNTGVDMSTGDLAGLVWIKNRDAADSHILTDTFRTAGETLSSDSTAAEVTDADTVTSFDATGFSVGADLKVNTNLEDYVAWSFQTNQKFTGTTNRSKAYTAHYNADMGFSIVGYEGDGVDGHEIPHFLGVEPELVIWKNRDAVVNWFVQGSDIGDSAAGDYLILDTTGAVANSGGLNSIFSADTIATGTANNTAADNMIAYHFASVPGVSKVGKYIGTGAAGNYVDCGFKAGFVLVKNLTTAASWWMLDNARGDNRLLADASDAESATTLLDMNETGFNLTATSTAVNNLNDEYLFLAFADSGSGPTDYAYPINDDQLAVNNDTLLSFANGFSTNGQVDTQELTAGSTIVTLGAGHEDKHYWMYKDKAGSYAFSETRPLEGIARNDADKWGVVSPSDVTLRTTAKHFDYESATGVALASGETATFEAYKAFDKDSNQLSTSKWRVASTTTSTLQYKQDEKRILKSWRMRASDDADTIPRQFTIEGSNDGSSWAAIDSTYTASDFTDPGVGLWSALQSASGNTTAYLYHRVNTTLNHGDATNTDITELEFNTILPSDYYLVNKGQMYNSSDAAIERIYLAEVRTGGTGDVTFLRNLPVAKAKADSMELQGTLTVHGEIENRGVATAWALVDETQNPPLVLDSHNIVDVVDGGTVMDYIVDSSIDLNSACIPNSVEVTIVSKNRFRITSSGIARRSVAVFGGKEIL
jgi:hypothetical protein